MTARSGDGGSEDVPSEKAAGTRVPPDLRGQGKSHLQERIVGGVLLSAAGISILTTIGIVVVLLVESLGFFTQVSLLDFLTGTRWAPLFRPQSFGVLPLLTGSLLIAAGSAIVALPIGLASAIYLSEYANPRVRKVVKPALEVLAGVPTVVYGYFALTFVTPMLRTVWPQTDIFNAAAASIVVGIMIVPMVSSLSEDAMTAVPRALREGAYALGATRLEVAIRTVVPAALSGIIASFILAISRAIGETMAVAIAAGNMPNLTLNPLESVQTMTAYIVQISLGETPYGTIEYRTIFAVGLTLFAMTLTMNLISNAVLRRFREVYE
ncbi:MAG TPA: phosphate ABC transporter permease subunit PstC [Longimicrobiales bacterium]|nr:phosphate ABC transporter permease subunit PstC [Longimicrobiales bacterium]